MPLSQFSNALLLSALDSALTGIVITDNKQPDNPIIYCNRSFEMMTGYKKAEIMGHNCRFLQNQDSKQEPLAVMSQHIKEAKSCKVILRNYRKDTSLFFNEVFMSPVFDTSGQASHFIGIMSDITPRIEGQNNLRLSNEKMQDEINANLQDLKQNEEFLESIFQTVRAGLIVMDQSLKVLIVNDFFLETFKVSSLDSIGKNLVELGIGQWNIPRLTEMLSDVLPSNNPIENFEVEVEFPHIGKRLMVLNANRIKLKGSVQDKILLSIEDITSKREIERRKDDFLSIASHELKTPITSVSGYLQLASKLLDNENGKSTKAIVDKAILNISRLTSLVNELLNVSKIETGNVAEQKTDIEFDHLLKEAIEHVQTSATRHQIKLTGSSNSIVNADETHITQVLDNLLSNAIKYSPNSDVVIVHVAGLGEFLKCSIKDFGVGIAKNDHPKLFEKFFRAPDTQRTYPGMGIGLFVSNQIIKKHGGTMWVESEKEQGSTFNFTLPVVRKV